MELQTNTDPDEIKQVILENIQSLLLHLKVEKVFFVDDAIDQDTGKETFKGIVQSVISSGKLEKLREISILGIDFKKEESILIDHIDEVWDNIKPGKQLRYFEKVYTIVGRKEDINDLNVSNNLKEFFKDEQIEFLTPIDWDAKHEQILAALPPENRIIVLFDQDLKLAGGRYTDQLVQGEQLILELKEKGLEDKVIISLLTHTITQCEDELPKRSEICDKISTLNVSDFFVLAKVRLEKPEMFADGLKKVSLNSYCENIKARTIEILKEAQNETIKKLENFDTYDFDYTIFKSSYMEGVWEPETLLRITDVIFKDEVRKLMISKNYVTTTNPAICSANEISKLEFKIENPVNPYNERFKLRHQEIFESGALLNGLRKPIDNGDIFEITDGERKTKKFILVAQECDMMVRSDTGTRGAKIATLLEIETLSDKQLLAEMKRKYEGEIRKEKFLNHFFADRFKLEYFEDGSNKTGLIHFSKSNLVDLNVLDLIVFNDLGEATLDLFESTYLESFHNTAWKSRYKLILKEFSAKKEVIEKQYAAIDNIDDPALKKEMQIKFNHLFSFIEKVGIQLSFNSNKFSFGIKRIARLRQPKSKHLLDRYYQHLSRTAELHDFAGID
ncbi:MAG: hypothetical protein ACKVOU_04535 [Cytophagales bacterium]